MQSKIFLRSIFFVIIFSQADMLYSQQVSPDSLWQKTRKNIIRYNISGGLLFGFDKFAIIGYERVVNPHQSFSVDVGAVRLPKLVSINTDSFSLQKDVKNSGFNFSVDYRFYLAKENKYGTPHGIYAGPFLSYNHFKRDNIWKFQKSGGDQETVPTNTNLNIFTVGAELGYQFILWRRLAIDMVVVGPGIANYNLKVKIEGNLTDGQGQNLHEAVIQLISQKFPGMNYVFSDKEFDASGTLGTWDVGFRYLINIGFNF